MVFDSGIYFFLTILVKNKENKMAKMKITLLAAACCLPILSAAVNAESEGKFYINPAIGYQTFGEDRNLDNTMTTSIGGEYVISPEYGIEASYLRSNPDIDSGGGDADVDLFTIDGLHYLNSYLNWQPFVNAGLGHGEFDESSGEEETQINAGLGSRYQFSNNLSARLQAKVIHSFDEKELDTLFTAGISYAFGGKSKPAPVPPPVILKDGDKDGVLDENDSCLATPEGVTVDDKGCGLDSDNDGVFDTNDLCMETAEGAEVDATGCELDKDEDGVADYKDMCPNTEAGAKVNEKGCLLVPKTETIKLAINFANNSAEVPSSSMAEIKDVADFMTRNVNTTVAIEGYTDNRGNPAYNKTLSQKRADAVMEVLVNDLDVSSDRVTATGYGADNPIADNSTSQGRSENRRVVAEITHTDK